MKYEFKDWSIGDFNDFNKIILEMAKELVHVNGNEGMKAISDQTGVGLHIVKLAYGVTLAKRAFRGDNKDENPLSKTRNFKSTED